MTWWDQQPSLPHQPRRPLTRRLRDWLRGLVLPAVCGAALGVLWVGSYLWAAR